MVLNMIVRIRNIHDTDNFLIYFWRMVINLCLGIYIAQAEDEEFSVVDAV